MSRQKPGNSIASGSGPTVEIRESDPPRTSSLPGKPSGVRRLFLPVVLLVAVWWIILAGLVVFTANPITLNRRQIHIAQQNGVIVTARVVDADKGRIEVLKDWTTGTSKGKELSISGLSERGVKNGETYILPLTVSQNGSPRITPASDSRLPPPIYPATAESERQLQELLNEWKNAGSKL